MTDLFFRVRQRDIAYIKFILEAYEGMNVMSTADNGKGIIKVSVMPGFEHDMDGLLEDMGKEIVMEKIPDAESN